MPIIYLETLYELSTHWAPWARLLTESQDAFHAKLSVFALEHGVCRTFAANDAFVIVATESVVVSVIFFFSVVVHVVDVATCDKLSVLFVGKRPIVVSIVLVCTGFDRDDLESIGGRVVDKFLIANIVLRRR